MLLRKLYQKLKRKRGKQINILFNIISMNIKSFENFTQRSGDLYDFGCVMAYLNIPNWNSIVLSIDESDLYKPDDPVYGYETSPHVTILYGLHTEVDDSDVIDIFKNRSLTDIEIEGIGCFENKDYDVIKMNIKSDKLLFFNTELMKLPHTTEFPDYKPHITMAYVLPGLGKKYVDSSYRHTFNKVNKIVYSKPDGEKVNILLN